MCYKTKIFEKNSEIVKIQGKNYSEIFFSIKNVLVKIRKDMTKDTELNQEMNSPKKVKKQLNLRLSYIQMEKSNAFFKNYILSVDGKCLDIIMEHRYLMNHFAFIIYFSKAFLTFNCDFHQKFLLSKLVSKKFEKQKLIIIGNGYDIIGYKKKSNLIINLLSENEINNIMIKEGDIVTSEIELLNDFLFINSYLYSIKLRKIIIYMFMSSFLLTWPIFYYFIITDFSNFLLLEDFQIIFKDTFMNVIPIFLYFFFGETFNPKIIEIFPEILKSDRYSEHKIIFHFLDEILVQSFFVSIFIFLISFFTLSYDIGNFHTFSRIGTEIYLINTILIFLNFSNEVAIFLSLKNIISYLIFGFTFFIGLLISYSLSKNLFASDSIIVKSIYIITHSDNLLDFLFILTVTILFKYILLIFRPFLSKTLYYEIYDDLKGEKHNLFF